MSHTPGPWTWDEIDDLVSDGLNAPSGTVLSGQWFNDGTAGVYIYEDADAQLITAAPDLLEAAREALSILTALSSTQPVPPQILDKLETATKKAEGR